jgi:hypothetical protein
VRLRKALAGQGLDAGPQTIAWHLERHHKVKVSPATISRCLARAGLVAPDPPKRPRSSCTRFAAEQPNECRQSDFTRYPLADGTGTEIVTWPGDHSRYALSLTVRHRVTGPAVLPALRAACELHGARLHPDRRDGSPGAGRLRHPSCQTTGSSCHRLSPPVSSTSKASAKLDFPLPLRPTRRVRPGPAPIAASTNDQHRGSRRR